MVMQAVPVDPCTCGHPLAVHGITDIGRICRRCSCEWYTRAAADDSATAPVSAGVAPDGVAPEKVADE